MGLEVILKGLDREIAKHGQVYAEGRARRAELASYETAGALLVALQLDSPLSLETRNAITIALVTEQQRGKHPLWQALLLQAYAPMLRSLKLRDDGNADVEERAVMAFLEAVQRLPLEEPPARAASYLKNATDWAVHPRWRHVHPQPKCVPLGHDEVMSRETWAESADDVAELRRVLEAEPNKEELFEVLVATIADNEPLFAFLGRTRPGLGASEKWKAYRRLGKQRERVIRELQRRLGDGTLQQLITNCTLCE